MSDDKTVRCSNCAALIGIHEKKCPYCGYINPEGAEENYMNNLAQVRNELDHVDEAAADEYKKSLKGGLKTSAITFIVMIVLILGIFGLYLLMADIMEDSLSGNTRTPEEEMAELAAEREFFPKLDSLYDSGDYEGLVKLAQSGEAQNVDMWNYPHYEFLDYYQRYVEVRDIYVPMLDGGKLDKENAAWFTESVFGFYYRCYDNTMGLSVEKNTEDVKVLDGIRDEYMMPILHSRMFFTDEDMEAAKGAIMENGYFHVSEAYKYSDRYYERYR